MISDENLRVKLKEFLSPPIQVFHAVVKSIDLNNQCCTVTPFEAADIDDVRLKGSVDKISDGIVEVPKVGSTVLVGLIGNDEDTAYVVKCTEVEKLIINGGTLGGMVKAKVLKTELDKTNAILQAMMNVFQTSWTPVTQDGGAALKIAMNAALAGKLVGDFTKIENEKVTH
jgi:hypothetical protein